MSQRRPRSTSDVVNQMAGHLEALGFQYLRVSGGHLLFESPEFGKTQLPSTPSETHRWADNKFAQLARQMGTTTHELKMRLGIRQEKRSGPRIKRQRNEAGRAARTFTVTREEKPPPERVGTAHERMAEVSSEIAETDQRLTYATGDLYKLLLSKRSRLSSEYMQLEADSKAAA